MDLDEKVNDDGATKVSHHTRCLPALGIISNVLNHSTLFQIFKVISDVKNYSQLFGTSVCYLPRSASRMDKGMGKTYH